LFALADLAKILQFDCQEVVHYWWRILPESDVVC